MMKKLFRIWGIILLGLLSLSVSGYAQHSPSADSSNTLGTDPPFTYQCGQIIYDTGGRMMTLLDNVSFETPAFNLRKAGKVVYDMKEKKFTIYDCEDFTFNGKIQIKASEPHAPRTNVVQYTFQDDTVYVR